ncbi:MAG: hypothetical protein KGI90_00710 [Burkholderiales bacterium]|nr:hypothetical protein [Burkholderiales bacterium]MDE2275327.1 hypothetical protein [Burkholderiales bacterium]
MDVTLTGPIRLTSSAEVAVLHQTAGAIAKACPLNPQALLPDNNVRAKRHQER